MLIRQSPFHSYNDLPLKKRASSEYCPAPVRAIAIATTNVARQYSYPPFCPPL